MKKKRGIIPKKVRDCLGGVRDQLMRIFRKKKWKAISRADRQAKVALWEANGRRIAAQVKAMQE